MLDRFLTVVSLFTLYDTDILSAIAFYGGPPLLFKSKKVGKISTRLSCKGGKKRPVTMYLMVDAASWLLTVQFSVFLLDFRH